MITRLEIATKPDHPDARGEALARRMRSFLSLTPGSIRSADVYHIDARLDEGEAERILRELTDPVLQHGSLSRLDHGPFDVAVRVGYKPGVTDPVGKSARVAVEDTLGRSLEPDAAVFTSTLFLIEGLDRVEAERAARELIGNPVIQTLSIKTREEFLGTPPDMTVPRVQDHGVPAVKRIDLSGSDEELLRISREGLLALTLEEMQAIRDHFVGSADDPRRRELGLDGRPTDVELECLAQTWSEHCKHKIFNASIAYHDEHGAVQHVASLFKDYIKKATHEVDAAVSKAEGNSWLVSVFHDNAGVVTFDDDNHLVYKVETHNSPSALDPYGGAITGIVGVNRDPFGTGRGADLIANVWGYCFASPFFERELPEGLLHPRRIRDGVHQGVIDGGNQSGVPYGRGFEVFDHRFVGKPLVFCGTVGALPVSIPGPEGKPMPGEEKAAHPGDLIVMTGGRIGADGIHGATFSSAALDESAPVQAVQIGDPITQKRMFDFLLEARELGLYRSITDNGAGGLSSSVGEMAESSNGATLDLAKAPLKYAGLAPWEILVSEAQERMTLAVPPQHAEALLELAARREVEATVVGTFHGDGVFHVTYGDETVAYIPMEFLHEGDPDLDLTARWSAPRFAEPAKGTGEAELGGALLAMLSRLNLCSGEVKARHYDHEVKALSMVKPFVGVQSDVPAEATVSLLRHPADLAAEGAWRGFVLSEGIQPFYSDIDTHAMAVAVVDEALRKQLCAGARPDRIAMLDNFCWPDPVQSEGTPDGEYKLAQLVRACRGLFEATTAYGTPLISGKDSMKNDSTKGGVKISVPPTLLVSAIGQIDDARRAVTLDPKSPGDVVLLIGETRDETGGSEYLRYLGERDGVEHALGEPGPYVGNKVPRLDPTVAHELYGAVAGLFADGLVRSAATPARGGLGLALARCALAGRLGLDIDLPAAASGDLSPDTLLFSESCGRFVLTCAPEDVDGIVERLSRFACHRIGTVDSEPRLAVAFDGRPAVELTLEALERAFKQTLEAV